MMRADGGSPRSREQVQAEQTARRGSRARREFRRRGGGASAARGSGDSAGSRSGRGSGGGALEESGGVLEEASSSERALNEALWRSRRWACAACGGPLRLLPPQPPTTANPDAAVASNDHAAGNRAVSATAPLSPGPIVAAHATPFNPGTAGAAAQGPFRAEFEPLACAQCGSAHAVPPPPRWAAALQLHARSAAACATPARAAEAFGYAALEGAVAGARRAAEALRKRHRAEEDADAPESESEGDGRAALPRAARRSAAPLSSAPLSSGQAAAARQLARRARHAAEAAEASTAALQAQ
jgi:hypothetical protein